MARLRELSVGLTPDKPGGRHMRLRNLPLVWEGPPDINDLDDRSSEEQDSQNDYSDTERDRKTPTAEVERQLVAEFGFTARAIEDEAENAGVDRETDTDRGNEGDLVRAGDRLVGVSGRIGEVAQRLQGQPATPKGRSLRGSSFVDSADVPKEVSGSEAEAERSAARLNAAAQLSIRSRQHPGTQPTNLRRAKRITTGADPSFGNLPAQSVIKTLTSNADNATERPSRAPKALRKSTASGSTSKDVPAGKATVPQSLSPSKRKRGNPIREYSEPRGDQASTKNASTTSVIQPSGSRKLPRPPQIYHDMTRATPRKIQNDTSQNQADPYNPQSSPGETRAAAKRSIRITRTSSRNSNTLYVRDRNPIGTRTRRAGGGTHDQQHLEQVQQEGAAGDEVLEVGEGEMVPIEPAKKPRGVRADRQTQASRIASSEVRATGRTTRANPAGDKAVSQNPAREQVVLPVSSKSKSARIVSQRTETDGEVIHVVSTDSRRSTRMETRASEEGHHAAGGSGQRTSQETRHEHHKQPSSGHHIRRGRKSSTQTAVPTKLSFGQSLDAEDTEAGDAVQPEEANGSDVGEYVEPVNNNLSVEEEFGLVMDYVHDIRAKRRSTRECETKVMSDFLNDIDEMRKLYTRLGRQERGTDQYDRQQVELDDFLEGIKDQSELIISRNIRILPIQDRTAKVVEEKRKTLQDLYTWVIPDLVFAIKKAVDCYADRSIPSSELRRIMELQDLVVKLGDSKWRREVWPDGGSRDFPKQFDHAVLPSIARLRKAYEKELGERRGARERRVKENLQRRIAAEERRRREREREIRRRRRIIHEHVLSELARTNQKYSANQRRGSQQREAGSRLAARGVFAGNKPNEWSEAELLALVQGLEKFTGRDRYAQIVQEHCGPGGVLQSRSMDELFEKAKEVKADVYADWELHPDRPLPDYILSI